MDFAEKEYKRMQKKEKVPNSNKKEASIPIWFNQKIEKEEVSEAEAQELAELFKDFR